MAAIAMPWLLVSPCITSTPTRTGTMTSSRSASVEKRRLGVVVMLLEATERAARRGW